MKKVSVAILLGVLCFSIFQVAHFPYSQGEARYKSVIQGDPTIVSGFISENTTWTLSSSPYIVEGNVVVESGIYLTIEAGVLVEFNTGTTLFVDGGLIARGNLTNWIVFTSNASVPQKGDWEGIYFRDSSDDASCIIEYGVVNFAQHGISIASASPRIGYCNITDNHIVGINCEWGAPSIYGCLVTRNYRGITFYSPSTGTPFAAPSITDNEVRDNQNEGILFSVWDFVGPIVIERNRISANGGNGIDASLAGEGSVRISSNIISNNTENGIYIYEYDGNFIQISSNTISNNTQNGVYCDGCYGNIQISDNTISSNTGSGILSEKAMWWPHNWSFNLTVTENMVSNNKYGFYGSNSTLFVHNSIVGNKVYSVYNADAILQQESPDLNATFNWWGTTNETLIEEEIYDYYDKVSLGKVLYSPYLTAPPLLFDGTIYIRIDGSIDPPAAPIQRNGDVYVLTSNISSSSNGIVIERNNLILEGAGYSIEGNGTGTGILWGDYNANNITVTNIEVRSFHRGFDIDGPGASGTLLRNRILENNIGIEFFYSSNNVITENIITNNGIGIGGTKSSGNVISENNITDNTLGISIDEIGDNWWVYHNNFLDSLIQATSSDLHQQQWDDGYPSGGNYWSDYNENDTNHDGIGDTPYVIGSNDQDRYPLIRPWGQNSSIPAVIFRFSPIQPLADEEVVFDASASYDLDGFITNYTWDFGDGTEISGSEVQSHSYSAAEMYNVTLTVMDNSSLSGLKTRRIVVDKIPSEIILSTDPTELRIGEQAMLSGSIYPSRPGSNVTIWFRLDGEPAWQVLAGLQTDETSQYMYSWTPPVVGIYSLKANWMGDDKTISSESSQITIACSKIQTELSLSTTSSTTFVGFQVNMTGRLTDVDNVSLTGETVVLYYTFSGITTWTPITSAITNGAGEYSATWIPTATGYFVLKAEWAGNATHSFANNTTNLSTISYSNQYVFAVESNSTISEFTFNTIDWALSFSATGPNDTTGYVRITTAKTLVPNPENIRVYLDGNQTQFSIHSIGDSWLLTFEYQHSSHQVQVDLDVTIIPEFSVNLLLLLFSVVVLAFAQFKRRSSRARRCLRQCLSV